MYFECLIYEDCFKAPPPPKFSDFFLKSEGKEIERKKIGMLGGGGGGYLLTYF